MKKLLLTFFAITATQVWAVAPVPFTKAIPFTTKVTGSITSTLTVQGESTESIVNNSGGGPESSVETVYLRPGKAYPMTMAGTVSTGTGTYTLSFTAPEGYAIYINNLPADYFESGSISGSYSDPLTLEVRAVNASGGGAWGKFSGVSIGQGIAWQVGLGDLRTGRSAGGIQFREQDMSDSPNSRSRLYYTVPDNVSQITVIKDGTPAVNLRQIVTPIGFTDLVDVSGGYEIRFYRWDQLSGTSGGLYTFGSAAWKKILVHSPADNELNITETENSVVRVSHFTATGASGGTISEDGSYTVHTFNSSGTFTVLGGISTMDYMVAGGGGGGGSGTGGGGGGGGSVEYLTGQSVSSGALTVTVGAGGACDTNGGNSTFNSTIGYGGGYGSGPLGNFYASSGGSGGAGHTNQFAASAGSGSNVYKGGGGDNGGTGWSGGGGGGAGGDTQNASQGGGTYNGGNGIQIGISGISPTPYYGGGGGGGNGTKTGGLGGGGNGGTSGAGGSAGTANTGGGGGGSGVWGSWSGGAGGSGIVIVRYLTPSGSNAGDRIWTLQEGNGSLTNSTDSDWKRTTTHRSSVPATDQRDVIVEVRTGGTNGTVVAETKYHYVTKAWGEEVTQIIADPDGDALTTTYTYHENSSNRGNYGQVRSVTDSTGNWTAYEYYDDLAKRGQLHYEYRPFRDEQLTVPSTLDPTEGRVVILNYDYDWTGRDRALVSREVKINNVLTAKTTRDQDFDYSITTPRNRFTQNNFSDDTYKTQTHVQNWREDAVDADLVGQPYYLITPDLIKTSTSVSRGTYNPTTKEFEVDDEGLHWRKLTVHGSYTSDESYGDTDEVSTYDDQSFDDIWLVENKSTMDVTIRIAHGIVYRTETLVWTGSDFELLKSEDFTYDGYGQLTKREASNSAETTYSYTYGQLLSTTDATGIETQYTYDLLGRVDTMIKKGLTVGATTYPDITTTYTYDGANRVTQTVVSDGTLSQTSSKEYDLSGRVTSSTAPGNYETEYDYSLGARKIKVIHPDAGYKITETYYDGQVKSVTGDAVIPKYFDYSVISGGNITRRVDSLTDPSVAYVETTTDWLGRKITETKPGWDSSSTVTTTWTYDTYYGYLNMLEQPGMTATYYKYDTMGRLVREGLDIDTTAGLQDNSASDRITDYAWEFFSDSGDWWRRETTQTYATASSSTATVTAKVEQQITGLDSGQFSFSKSYDVSGNVTTQSVDVVRGSKKVTTTTATSNTTDGDIEQIAYNGLVVESTDSTGLTMNYIYDGLGRLKTSEDPRTGISETAYKAGTSQVDWVKDAADTAQATYTYDDAGRVKAVKDAYDNYIRYEYNKRGQKRHEWGEATYPIEYVYDDYGRLEYQKTYRSATGLDEDEWGEVTSGSADTTTFEYQEKTGFLSKKKDAADKEVEFTYTQAGQIETRKLARGVITTYDYDDDTGELLSQTYSDDPASTPTVTYTYNRLGQVATVVDDTADVSNPRIFTYNLTGTLELQTEELGDGGTDFYGDRLITYGYDSTTGAKGRPIAFQLGNGTSANAYQEIDYGYQDSGRLSTIEDVKNGRTFTYGYTADSNLIESVASANYTDTRTYGDEHDWTKTRTAVWNSGTATVKAKFDYDLDNTNPVDDGRDKLGRVTHVIKSGEMFEHYESVSSPDIPGIRTNYAYDARSQLIDEQTVLKNSTGTFLTGRNNMPGSGNHGFTYDQLGNRATVTHNGETTTYTQNSLNQYTQRTVPGYFDVAGAADTGATVTVESLATTRHSEYFFKKYALTNTLIPAYADLTVDDGTTMMDLPAYLAKTPEPFTYDEDGNLTRDGRWVYEYDAENRLVQMYTRGAPEDPDETETPNEDVWDSGVARQKLIFKYDYMGRRVQKITYIRNGGDTAWDNGLNIKYVYDGWNCIAEMEGGSITKNFFWGLDLSGTSQGAGGVGGLLMIEDDGDIYLPAYDAMGNIHALITTASVTLGSNSYVAGDIVATYEYDAFGQTLCEGGDYAADNAFRFSTKYTDNETALVYYGHRYYSPSLGRFINRDPIEEQGGINLYSFVGNNSINAWDYLGMDAFMTTYMTNDGKVHWVEGDGMSGQDHLDAATWASNYAVTGTGNYTAENSGAGAPSGRQANRNLRKFNALPPAVQDQVLRDLGVDMGTSGSAPNGSSNPNPNSRSGSKLGDALGKIPLIGPMLRPLGDIIAGVGNASLGAVTFGQSGTLGRGLGQIGNGIIGETEILLTDVVAFATGTVRYGSQVVTRSVDVLTLGNIHSDGNPLVAIGELVSRAIIPGYGNHGGRGLGREGLPIFNHRDRGSRYHDAKFGQEPYANTRWVVHGFEPSPREGDVADGPLAIAYTLAGTVPFLFYDLVFPQPSKKP